MKFQTQYAFKYKKEHNETPKGDSMTIQGEAYSIKELVARLQAGQELDRKTVYHLDPDEVQNINGFYRLPNDLTDLDAIRQHNLEVAQQLDDLAKKKAADAHQKRVEESKKENVVVEPKTEE